jgi:hypothetical protein
MYDTANGSFWHRASFDGYGERPDGTQWEPVPPGSRQTIGRGWPLLTGERGEYALAAGQPAQEFLDTMAHVAEDSGGQVIAEKVWDHNSPHEHRGRGSCRARTPSQPRRSLGRTPSSSDWPAPSMPAARSNAGNRRLSLREAVPALSASAARAPHCDRATAGVSS